MNQSTHIKGGSIGVLLAAVVAVVLLWAWWGFAGAFEIVERLGLTKPKVETGGPFGDVFGGINALFTGLAFAVVAWTGWLQYQALHHQQLALEVQRREADIARKAQAIQTFEAALFQLLALVRSLHDQMEAQHPAWLQKVRGKEAMALWADRCQACFTRSNQQVKSGTTFNLLSAVGAAYEVTVYGNASASLGPYFRSLYHLFKFIATQPPSTLTADEMGRYARLARAHLSADDLVVLAANLCSDPGEGFRDNVELFRLLKHFPEGPSRAIAIRALGERAFSAED